MDDQKIGKHESYGVMEISRVQHGPSALFCSSIPHEHTIRLRISAAELRRDHHADRAFASHALKDRYVDVEMSYTQFAEAITSLNMGAGIPVTVRYANGRHMEPCPFASKDEQFRAEFKSDLAGLAATVDGAISRVEALFDSKKPLTKGEKEELLSELRRLSTAVNSNIPYVRDLFVEQMDKTVAEAKSNIEGFIQNRMNALANNAIADALANGGTKALPGLLGGVQRADTPEVGEKPSVLKQLREGVPNQEKRDPRKRAPTSPEIE